MRDSDLAPDLELFSEFIWVIGIAVSKYESRNEEVASTVMAFRRLVMMEFNKLPSLKELPDPSNFLQGKIKKYDGPNEIEVCGDLKHLLYWLERVRDCSEK